MTDKWVIGVDLGGTTTKLAFIDLNGRIINKWEIPTDITNEGENITSQIAKSIREKMKEFAKHKENFLGIGMGAPGPADVENGLILGAVNLGWKKAFPLKERMEAETSLPTYIDNDANCAALGEMWQGAGNGAKDLICITLGTGVGGGVITNGEIVHGTNGAAGEIGHYTSIAVGGAPCNCGKTGCLETIASATGIVRIANEKLQKERNTGELFQLNKKNQTITAKDIFDTARNGDDVAISVIRDIADYLGLALGNAANILNPDLIVIGGGVSKAGDLLLEPIKESFEKYAFSTVAQSTKLALATLGNDAGVIGAAHLVVKNI